jgi:hypothetical protein
MNPKDTPLKGYLILNRTDNILLYPEPFPTRQGALLHLRERLAAIQEHQGYWLTVDRRRIPVEALDVEIVEDRGQRLATAFDYL